MCSETTEKRPALFFRISARGPLSNPNVNKIKLGARAKGSNDAARAVRPTHTDRPSARPAAAAPAGRKDEPGRRVRGRRPRSGLAIGALRRRLRSPAQPTGSRRRPAPEGADGTPNSRGPLFGGVGGNEGSRGWGSRCERRIKKKGKLYKKDE